MEKRVAVNETGQPIIDWGETVPGKQKEMTLYIKNESKDALVLRQPFSTSEDLKIEDYPQRLQGEDYGMVKLSYKPNTESIESHFGSWGFEVVIG
jgi:hypothetical protein